MGRIVNVCISEKKGTQKHPIDEGEFIVEFGVKRRCACWEMA